MSSPGVLLLARVSGGIKGHATVKTAAPRPWTTCSHVTPSSPFQMETFSVLFAPVNTPNRRHPLWQKEGSEPSEGHCHPFRGCLGPGLQEGLELPPQFLKASHSSALALAVYPCLAPA